MHDVRYLTGWTSRVVGDLQRLVAEGEARWDDRRALPLARTFRLAAPPGQPARPQDHFAAVLRLVEPAPSPAP